MAVRGYTYIYFAFMHMYMCDYMHSFSAYLKTYLNLRSQKLDSKSLEGKSRHDLGIWKHSKNYFFNNRVISHLPDVLNLSLEYKILQSESDSVYLHKNNNKWKDFTIQLLWNYLIYLTCSMTYHVLPLCTKIIIEMGKFGCLHPRILKYTHFFK